MERIIFHQAKTSRSRNFIDKVVSAMDLPEYPEPEIRPIGDDEALPFFLIPAKPYLTSAQSNSPRLIK